ncbi:hypothetical protein [Larkinella soli]|nr:hypothetical protein [Larkinella soli]
MEIASEEDVIRLIDEPFLLRVDERFRQMHNDFTESMQRHELDW